MVPRRQLRHSPDNPLCSIEMKRTLDIIAVLLTAVFWIPLLAVTALAVLICDGRPVFFLQERAGLGGRPFKVLKFRTMDVCGNGEPEATRLGRVLRKLSLDEVPQLINVLKGDMSLVGPRPLPVAYLPRYSPIQATRHDVRPGITGWAQVHGRNSLTWDEKFAYDIEYVRSHSLLMDLKILMMTIPASFSGGDKMEEFKGA